ncbi:hypothetical protein BVI1335_1520040 [Burkholderia vietnamiensis]|nr:hypothetical protein BVI1335_1520040 [Burkholderia vietnamiensis]
MVHAHVALQLHRLEFSERRRNTWPATCRCPLPQLDVRHPALAESLGTISARTDTVSNIYELQHLLASAGTLTACSAEVGAAVRRFSWLRTAGI